MLHAATDIGDHLANLLLAQRCAAVGEDADWDLIFSDAIDPAGEVIFGTEGRFQKAIDDLAVSKAFLLVFLMRGNDRGFAGTGGQRKRGRKEAQARKDEGGRSIAAQ